MPWSPIPKFPLIIENLKQKGFKKQCTLDSLKKEVMRETGSIKDQTIKNTILAMEKLDYIRIENDIVTIEPKKWEKKEITPKEAKQEADELLDNF